MKRILPIVLTLALASALAACGETEQNPPPAPTPPAAEQTETPQDTPAIAPVSLTSRSGAIDFEDGNISFMTVNEAPANASNSVTVSVEEYLGSKMLKITSPDDVNKVKPYVAIDASSLLGDKISDVRSLECTVATVHPDGKFYAASGKIYGYCGEERKEVKKPWAVYVEDKNPNIAKFEMTKDEEYMVPGNYNFFVFSVEEDAGDGVVALYIDDICFLDAAGNVLGVDTGVTFDKPAGFGEIDRSNLIAVADETDLEYTGSSGGSWGQAISKDTTKSDTGVFDVAWIYPGCVVTVYFSSDIAPEVIMQSWTDGAPVSWGKVAATKVNDSNTIAQYTYDDLIAGFGTDDLAAYFDKFNVGDCGAALEVLKVTVGKAE